jgi:hypothetical protein
MDGMAPEASASGAFCFFTPRLCARLMSVRACNFDIVIFIKNCSASLPLMRMLIWIVGLLALGTSLDSSLYGGAYTRAFVSMIQDTHTAIGLK